MQPRPAVGYHTISILFDTSYARPPPPEGGGIRAEALVTA